MNAETLNRLLLAAVEFGYRAGEKGEWNLEMTLLKWREPQKYDGYGKPDQKRIRYIGPLKEWSRDPIEVFPGMAAKLVATGKWEYVKEST